MTNWITFYKAARKELKKVKWPDKDKVRETTLIVTACSAIFAIFLFLVDLGISEVFHFFFY